MSFLNKYPYTDFHELNLDWFLEEFKKVMTKVEDLDTTVQQFTDFVTNYFDNLDVQQEINEKLNQMVLDGTISSLLAPIVATYMTDYEQEIEQQNQTILQQNGRINALETRMDTFTHLAEGSTTGDAELIDARDAANGHVYASAGAAIRAQVNEIANDLASYAFDYTPSYYINTTSPISFVGGKPAQTNSGSWMSGSVACSPGDKFTVSGHSTNNAIRVYAFIDAAGVVLEAAPNNVTYNNRVIIAPANAAWLCLNSDDFTVISYQGKIASKYFEEIKECKDNEARLNITVPSYVQRIEITQKEFVSLQINSGTPDTVGSTNVRKCMICPITPNAYIFIEKLQTRFATFSFTTEYPTNGTVINHSTWYSGINNTDRGAQAQAGDNYLIFMFYDQNLDIDPYIDIVNSIHVYYDCVDYGVYDQIVHADGKMVNLLKYRPVGATRKPYIALSCDDGNAALDTITIPMIQGWKSTYGKDVPVTFGLMETSDVLNDAGMITDVIDVCTNDGCAIAVHGNTSYFNYSTRKELLKYLTRQDTVIRTLTGVSPSAVIYPQHDHNDFIQTLCGSLYGACGCGGSNYPYTYRDDADRAFYVGPKSNAYEIYRLAIHDNQISNTQDVRDIVDFAYANKLIICPYWHDVDFTGADAARLLSILNEFVDYGMSKGIEFIKLGDVPSVL